MDNESMTITISGDDQMERDKQMSDLMELIHKENEWLQKCDEDKIPHVGVFYVIEGLAYCDRKPYRDTRKIAWEQSRNRPLEHERFWKVLCTPIRQYRDGVLVPSEKKSWARHNEFFWPRGRVTYDSVTDTFKVASDKHVIEDTQSVNDVITEFHLPQDKTRVVPDDQYVCRLCRKEKCKNTMKKG